MNVCDICQADGVLEALGSWYCLEHLEQGLLDVADFVATARGWDRDETRDQLQQWLDQ